MFGTGFALPGRFLKLYAATGHAVNKVGEIRVNPLSDFVDTPGYLLRIGLDTPSSTKRS